MARDPDKIDRWITLAAVEAAIPAMEAKQAAIQSGEWDVPIDESEPS